MTNVGFSGTRNGMTKQQKISVREILSSMEVKSVHHGDCLGSDNDMHTIARELRLYIVGHPPVMSRLRAYCLFNEQRHRDLYIERNHSIVNESDIMIFTPEGYAEVERSGTWATFRYAKKCNVPSYLVYPDGRYVKH